MMMMMMMMMTTMMMMMMMMLSFTVTIKYRSNGKEISPDEALYKHT
jgi:hypothetical protein